MKKSKPKKPKKQKKAKPTKRKRFRPFKRKQGRLKRTKNYTALIYFGIGAIFLLILLLQTLGIL